jgi:non-homologous end joining protein Ku
MLTPDEISDPGLSAPNNGVGAPPSDADPGQQPDLAEFTQQIAAMTRDFDPAAHHDGYRDQLEALIQRK